MYKYDGSVDRLGELKSFRMWLRILSLLNKGHVLPKRLALCSLTLTNLCKLQGLESGSKF